MDVGARPGREGTQIRKRAPHRSRSSSGRRCTTANGYGRPTPAELGGTETTTETTDDETRLLMDHGNGQRRRSQRWRWDLNPRESCPPTRFGDLHHHVQPRPHRPHQHVYPEPHIPGRWRTATNETTTETGPPSGVVQEPGADISVRCSPMPPSALIARPCRDPSAQSARRPHRITPRGPPRPR
jgi:hypothetical protein